MGVLDVAGRTLLVAVCGVLLVVPQGEWRGGMCLWMWKVVG